MKYIRTKDGIYKTRQCYPEETLFGNVTYVYRHEFVKNKDIIAKADTIEELCDGFIGVPDKEWFEKNSVAVKGVSYFQKPFELEHAYEKDFANLKLKNQNSWEYTTIEWQNRHYFIFGYVETDKGLIYVVKMNDEGVLELL